MVLEPGYRSADPPVTYGVCPRPCDLLPAEVSSNDGVTMIHAIAKILSLAASTSGRIAK